MINLLKEKYIAHKKRGFTLIELIVVMAIIAVLVLLAAPRFIGHTEKAKAAQIQNDIRAVETKVDEYLIEHGDLEGWGEPVVPSGDNLYNKKGLVDDNNPAQPGSYRFVSDEILKEVKSKLDGTFYANNDGKVYYEHEKPLLGTPTESKKEPEYSNEEIQVLIDNDFIPVATADELNSIRNDTPRTYGKGTKWEKEYTGGLGKQYVQVANIDLSGYSEEGWNPIGTDDALSFTGTYDGGNYVIRGLEVKVKDEDKYYQGLFGYAEGATIRNVGLIDNKVTGNRNVGSLVGYANRSTIENSYATGSVKGTGDYVGGLAGYAYGSIIENSYATGSVEGSGNFAGGLVGEADSSTINNSYAEGLVTGTFYVGGLVGQEGISGSTIVTNSGNIMGGANAPVDSTKDISTISNSYATGSVEGTDYVGGLAGEAGEDGTIDNSYATGHVTGRMYTGGLVGSSWGTISNSHAIGGLTGTGYYLGGLVGSSRGTISNSYATGDVTGTSEEFNSYNVGGLVGDSRSPIISNSYATGDVTGEYDVGGLVGTNRSPISNSYATGSVTSTGTWKSEGGLVGSNYSTVSNSYWNIETTGQTNSAGEEMGKTTDEMKEQTTYTDWDFETVWEIDEGNDYPKLR